MAQDNGMFETSSLDDIDDGSLSCSCSDDNARIQSPQKGFNPPLIPPSPGVHGLDPRSDQYHYNKKMSKPEAYQTSRPTENGGPYEGSSRGLQKRFMGETVGFPNNEYTNPSKFALNQSRMQPPNMKGGPIVQPPYNPSMQAHQMQQSGRNFNPMGPNWRNDNQCSLTNESSYSQSGAETQTSVCSSRPQSSSSTSTGESCTGSTYPNMLPKYRSEPVCQKVSPFYPDSEKTFPNPVGPRGIPKNSHQQQLNMMVQQQLFQQQYQQSTATKDDAEPTESRLPFQALNLSPRVPSSIQQKQQQPGLRQQQQNIQAPQPQPRTQCQPCLQQPSQPSQKQLSQYQPNQQQQQLPQYQPQQPTQFHLNQQQPMQFQPSQQQPKQCQPNQQQLTQCQPKDQQPSLCQPKQQQLAQSQLKQQQPSLCQPNQQQPTQCQPNQQQPSLCQPKQQQPTQCQPNPQQPTQCQPNQQQPTQNQPNQQKPSLCQPNQQQPTQCQPNQQQSAQFSPNKQLPIPSQNKPCQPELSPLPRASKCQPAQDPVLPFETSKQQLLPQSQVSQQKQLPQHQQTQKSQPCNQQIPQSQPCQPQKPPAQQQTPPPYQSSHPQQQQPARYQPSQALLSQFSSSYENELLGEEAKDNPANRYMNDDTHLQIQIDLAPSQKYNSLGSRNPNPSTKQPVSEQITNQPIFYPTPDSNVKPPREGRGPKPCFGRPEGLIEESEHALNVETLNPPRGFIKDSVPRGFQKDGLQRGFDKNNLLRGFEKDGLQRGFDKDSLLRGFENEGMQRGFDKEDQPHRGFIKEDKPRGFINDDQKKPLLDDEITAAMPSKFDQQLKSPSNLSAKIVAQQKPQPLVQQNRSPQQPNVQPGSVCQSAQSIPPVKAQTMKYPSLPPRTQNSPSKCKLPSCSSNSSNKGCSACESSQQSIQCRPSQVSNPCDSKNEKAICADEDDVNDDDVECECICDKENNNKAGQCEVQACRTDKTTDKGPEACPNNDGGMCDCTCDGDDDDDDDDCFDEPEECEETAYEECCCDNDMEDYCDDNDDDDDEEGDEECTCNLNHNKDNIFQLKQEVPSCQNSSGIPDCASDKIQIIIQIPQQSNNTQPISYCASGYLPSDYLQNPQKPVPGNQLPKSRRNSRPPPDEGQLISNSSRQPYQQPPNSSMGTQTSLCESRASPSNAENLLALQMQTFQTKQSSDELQSGPSQLSPQLQPPALNQQVQQRLQMMPSQQPKFNSPCPPSMQYSSPSNVPPMAMSTSTSQAQPPHIPQQPFTLPHVRNEQTYYGVSTDYGQQPSMASFRFPIDTPEGAGPIVTRRPSMGHNDKGPPDNPYNNGALNLGPPQCIANFFPEFANRNLNQKKINVAEFQDRPSIPPYYPPSPLPDLRYGIQQQSSISANQPQNQQQYYNPIDYQNNVNIVGTGAQNRCMTDYGGGKQW